MCNLGIAEEYIDTGGDIAMCCTYSTTQEVQIEKGESIRYLILVSMKLFFAVLLTDT